MKPKVDQSTRPSQILLPLGIPEVPFLVPPKWLKRPHFSHFEGTRNGTSGAQIKILRSPTPPNKPPKPPKSQIYKGWRPQIKKFQKTDPPPKLAPQTSKNTPTF